MYEFEKMQIRSAELHRMTEQEVNQISPEWREDALRRQDESLEAHRRTAMRERPILIEFESRGYISNRVAALPILYKDYSSLVPTIFYHLKQNYEDKTLEYLARLLAIPAALYLWPNLMAMYREREPNVWPCLMDGLAIALSELCLKSKSREHLDEVREVLQDRTRGDSRILLLTCIRMKKDERSLQLVKDLSDDPDLKTEISSWKRKF